MTIIERIVQYADDRNLRRKDLYTRCGIPQSTFSSWVTANVTSIPSEFIPKIADMLNVSCEELLTGAVGHPISQDQQRLLDMYNALDWEGKQIVSAKIIAEKRRMAKERGDLDGGEEGKEK